MTLVFSLISLEGQHNSLQFVFFIACQNSQCINEFLGLQFNKWVKCWIFIGIFDHLHVFSHQVIELLEKCKCNLISCIFTYLRTFPKLYVGLTFSTRTFTYLHMLWHLIWYIAMATRCIMWSTTLRYACTWWGHSPFSWWIPSYLARGRWLS